MKTASAILMVGLAMAVYVVVSYVGMLGVAWLIVGSQSHVPPTVIVMWHLSAFLTGAIFSRLEPRRAPEVAVRAATMAVAGIWAFVALLDCAVHWHDWSAVLACLGFVVSVGLAAWLGCFVAEKAATVLAGFSVTWFQLVGPLATLVAASVTACVLRIMLVDGGCSPDWRRALDLCLFAILVIALATIGHVALLFAQSRKSGAAQ